VSIWIYLKFYRKIFPDYYVELEKAVNGCKTLLDLGCGTNSPIKYFSKKPTFCVGVDIFQSSIEESKKENIHNEYHCMNVLDIANKFKTNSFDCVLASDLIEHLTKKEGFNLLDLMEKTARKKVIIFTPNGFFLKHEFHGNPWQIHKSAWTANELKKEGFKVVGINGWKPLRRLLAYTNSWPKYLLRIISDMTQIFVKNHPEKAFNLLCIKEKEYSPKT
jgi:predicted TPR repeat methyltransferase